MLMRALIDCVHIQDYNFCLDAMTNDVMVYWHDYDLLMIYWHVSRFY